MVSTCVHTSWAPASVANLQFVQDIRRSDCIAQGSASPCARAAWGLWLRRGLRSRTSCPAGFQSFLSDQRTPTAAGFATGMAEGGCRSSISCPCPLDDAAGWPTLSASISEWLDSGCVPGLSAVGEGKRQTPSPSSLLVTSPPFTLRHDWWPAGESALGEEVLAGLQGGGAGQPDNWFFQCLTY